MDPNIANQHRLLHSDNDLIEYLSDLTRASRSFEYSGFCIEVQTIGVAKSLFWVFMYTPLYDLYERLFYGRPRGLYLRVLHPLPFNVDLILMNERQPRPNRSFEEAFYWEALDRGPIEDFLSDEMKRVLMTLDRQYLIKMTDDYIEFGPILYEPKETAEHLKTLLDQLPKPAQVELSDEPETNFDENALADGDLITVGKTTNDVQANLWKLALRTNGIPSQLFNAQSSGIYGGAVPAIDIRIAVPIKYKEEAIEIISHNIMGASGNSDSENADRE